MKALREIEAGKSVAQASREYQLHPTLIGKWQKHHAHYAEKAFSGNGNSYKAELERMIGQLTMENAL